MKSDLLKTLAHKAKNRMIHRNTLGKACGYGEAALGCSITVIDERDENFYEEVKKMITEEDYVKNPIKRLMNEERYKSLDARGQEKYLLDTIERFLKYRDQIEKENRSKIVY